MLDVADPGERAEAAEALIRSNQPVQFDLSKPAESRSLPSDLIKRLAEEKLPIVIVGASFPDLCFLDNVSFEAGLTFRQCAFSTLSAVNATFNAPLTLSGCTFQVCNFAYADLLEATFTQVSVAEFCSFQYASVEGFLDFSGSTLAALVLVGTSISGEVVANDAAIAGLYAQGASVDGTFSAMKTKFENQPIVDDMHVGALYLREAVFADVFHPARVKADGPFDADGASFAKWIGIERLSCATFSMQHAVVGGDAGFVDVDAENAMLSDAKFGGRLLIERGSVKGVFDVRGISVATDFIIERTALSDGANVAGVTAASLQLLDVTAGDVFADESGYGPAADGGETATRQSRFDTVIVRRSTLKSLRPAHWLVGGDVFLQSSAIDYGLFEDNDVGGFVVTSTKFREACFLGRNTFGRTVAWTNVSADGPVVFQRNELKAGVQIRLSTFGRLDFQLQPLPQTLEITSCTARQLRFEDVTRAHAENTEARARYDGCTIDLESSTYEQISCSVAELLRSLAPKPSRQQYVVLERALRTAGFDELGDAVYRSGRTWYNERVTRDLSVRLRGAIANWTTGYGLSITRITTATVLVPLVAFALLMLSPGSVAEPGTPRTCAQTPAAGTAAAAVGRAYVSFVDTKAELTDCRIAGLVPANAIELPLRVLGLLLWPLWLVIATGILKYAVKSGS